MLKSLNFKHIFYFYMVAKHSSISKASQVLNVSQSSISEQLKIFESNAGSILFDRSQKRMTLNSNGQALYATLDEFFPAIEELFESLRNHKSIDVKFLRIGLCPSLSSRVRFQVTFPFIEDIQYTVRVLQGENQFLLDAFNRDDIDLLFTTNKGLKPMGKSEKFLIKESRFHMVCNKKFYKSIDLNNLEESLSGRKFINYTSDSDLHFQVFDFFHKSKIHPIRIAEIDDISLIKSTLMQLDCFSILPFGGVKEELAKKQLCRIDLKEVPVKTDILALYKPKFHSEQFLRHLESSKQYFQDLD